MGRPNKLIEEQQEEIVRLYQEGVSVHAIAAKFHVSQEITKRILDLKGVYALSKRQEEEIVRLHCEGLSLRAIADKFSIQPQRIQRMLQRKGIRIITEEQKNEMVRLYQEGLSLATIALRFPVRRESIWNVLKRKGVKTRPRIEAVNKALTTYTHDATFFDLIDTEEKAYWLGFIMADGNVFHKDGTDYYTFNVGVKESDRDHLKKLKASLNSSHPIVLDKRTLFRFKINNKTLCKALIRQGVVPRKSSKELTPPQMPKELLRHFWRGYFDGDGSLYITLHGPKQKSGSKYKQWGFNLLGSRTLLESFVEWAWSQGLLSRRLPLHRIRNSKTFETKSRRDADICNVMKALYKDATVYLDRKMDKYRQLTSIDGKDGQLNLPLSK
ncbi:MAG: helix-turn-helix domain-containing protein [Candidatus Brocadiales bacterium]